MYLKKYEGIEIYVETNGRFSATVGEVEKEEYTLRDLEEWINKEIAANKRRKPIKLNLPVIKIHKEGIEVDTIISIHRGTSRLRFKGNNKEKWGAMLIPNTPEAVALANIYTAAVKAMAKIHIGTNVGYGRKDEEFLQVEAEKINKWHASTTEILAQLELPLDWRELEKLSQ